GGEAPPLSAFADSRAEHLLDFSLGTVGVARSLGIATLNAMAQSVHPPIRAQVLDGIDALHGADVQPSNTVVLVGALVPFMRSLQQTGNRFWVIEQDPQSIPFEHARHFVPAHRSADIIAEADVLVVTGATLANNTFGEIVGSARPSARIAVVGPSVPMVPEAFF